MINISAAIIKLCIISLFGAYLYKKSVITDNVLEFLVLFVVRFTIPFLFFSRLLLSSGIILNNSLGKFVILSVLIFGAGYYLGLLFTPKKDGILKREFISMASFQNGGYLPMNIAVFLLPLGVRDKFLVFIVLYLLGFNILFWSLGSYFIFKKKNESFSMRSIFTPPTVSTLLALFLIYTGLSKFIPHLILMPLEMIGDLSFVLSMIILGCWLARIKIEGIKQTINLFLRLASIRLILVPLIFLGVIVVFKMYTLFGLLVIVEACMPSAVSLPIIAHIRKANSEFISQGILVTHILSIITIPFWLSIFAYVSGFSF
ncbi:MAG: AEC family transporter [Candidatus Omnitrophota bacterium]